MMKAPVIPRGSSRGGDAGRPPLTSMWREVDGLWLHTRMSTLSTPDLAALVLVHGLGVSSRYMVGLGEALAKDFHVFAPDLPGFGLSEKPARALGVPGLADVLLRWMDAMSLRSAYLLGNSFGAQVAVDLAARYSERVEKVILVGPTMDPEARSLTQLAVRWLRCIPQEPPALIWTAIRDVLDCGPLRVLWTLHHMLVDHLEDKLPLVRAPLLAIRGARDALASQAWIETIADRAPYGSHLTMPAAVHAANFDAVERLAEIVRDFVDAPAHTPRSSATA
jgi:pimeloyl-ACP methyl ester carboxylesterase